ncbi:hypothetical protein MY11210_004320 [Beauveria gryllotalpidicola]
MEAWLNDAGTIGLRHLKVAEFALTGRGVQAQRAFSTGERILTIPAQCLWTVEHAYADELLGPVLRGLQPPLSVEDTLVLHILLVRARPDEAAYEGRRSHVDVLPDKYTMSIFFSDEEMQVCAGSSLYTLTEQLRGRIGDDYKKLLTRCVYTPSQSIPTE